MLKRKLDLETITAHEKISRLRTSDAGAYQMNWWLDSLGSDARRPLYAAPVLSSQSSRSPTPPPRAPPRAPPPKAPRPPSQALAKVGEDTYRLRNLAKASIVVDTRISPSANLLWNRICSEQSEATTDDYDEKLIIGGEEHWSRSRGVRPLLDEQGYRWHEQAMEILQGYDHDWERALMQTIDELAPADLAGVTSTQLSDCWDERYKPASRLPGLGTGLQWLETGEDTPTSLPLRDFDSDMDDSSIESTTRFRQGLRPPRTGHALGMDPMVLKQTLGPSPLPELFSPGLSTNPTEPEIGAYFPVSFVQVVGSRNPTLYSARNEAAVAGAYALNMLTSIPQLARQPEWEPVVFSLTSEGPIVELWIHFLTDMPNKKYCMSNIAYVRLTDKEGTRKMTEHIAAIRRWARVHVLDRLVKALT